MLESGILFISQGEGGGSWSNDMLSKEERARLLSALGALAGL